MKRKKKRKYKESFHHKFYFQDCNTESKSKTLLFAYQQDVIWFILPEPTVLILFHQICRASHKFSIEKQGFE